MKRFEILTLVIVNLIISLAASYLILWGVRETGQSGISLKGVTVSAPDRSNLLKNNRLLKEFLKIDVDTQFLQDPNLMPQVADHFLQDVLDLRAAEIHIRDKNYAGAVNALNNLNATHPFVRDRKNKIRLKLLYYQKNYAEFIRLYLESPDKKRQNQLFLLDSYVKTRADAQAFELFKALFARNGLKPLQNRLSANTLRRFLRQLNFDDWLKKIKYLGRVNRNSEFLREKKYIRFPQLVNLAHAEFAYNQKNYRQCSRYLSRVKDKRLELSKNRLLLKMNIRDEEAGNLMETLEQFQQNPAIYLELLVNCGSILLTQGKAEVSLAVFSRYLEAVRSVDVLISPILQSKPSFLYNAEHWKSIWLCAWLSYRLNDKEKAAFFFEAALNSPVQSYRIAALYWLGRLNKKNNREPLKGIDNFPFSYYYTRENPDLPPPSESIEPYIQLLNHARGKEFPAITAHLKSMVKINLVEEASRFIQWTAANRNLTSGEKHTLFLVESVMWLKRDNYAMAFIRFRDNFECYRCLRLPRFLRDIALPIKYADLVEKYGEEHDIDSALIYSLIREESYFRPAAVSSAKAYGLMQLLLKTARGVAYTHGRKVFRRDLFKPEINIKYGTEYLKFLLDKYNGKKHLALAAYNAGDHRVDLWLTQFPGVSAEEFIEMIPFTATRSYVKNILRNYYYYRFYYGQ